MAFWEAGDASDPSSSSDIKENELQNGNLEKSKQFAGLGISSWWLRVLYEYNVGQKYEAEERAEGLISEMKLNLWRSGKLVSY